MAGEPPEPDWSVLDKLGNYLTQNHDEPESEDQMEVFDFRFEALELNEEQIQMMRPPEDRLDTLDKVRPAVAALTNAQTVRLKRRARLKNRWSSTFQNSFCQKTAQAWKARLADAGSIAITASSLSSSKMTSVA